MTRSYRIHNVTLRHVVARSIGNADSLWCRLVGLLPYAKVAPDRGLWFENATSIHTIGMRATIDVIFLDADSRVIDMRESVPPNRFLVWNPRAKSLVELGAAENNRTNIRIGDRLALEIL
jgi:uncharacterized protein